MTAEEFEQVFAETGHALACVETAARIRFELSNGDVVLVEALSDGPEEPPSASLIFTLQGESTA